jgi:hypothetical protein
MQALILTIITIFTLTIAGCATPPVEGKITLTEAMEEVATGLNRMYEIRANGPKSGLLPSEATIVFNVSASKTHTGKLYVEAGANALDMLQVVKTGLETGTEIRNERGNQVTIKFTNLLFAPRGTLITMSPDSLDQTLTTFENHGYKTLLTIGKPGKSSE